jgi:hypothetical protein
MRRAVLWLSAAGSLLITGVAVPAAAQDAAYVESITGRALAFVGGKPALLGELDTIGSGTRVDLLADSELQVCHYQQQRIVTLKGPLRASIAQAGITTDGGKPVPASAEKCAKPATSTFQGGVLVRATVPQATKVALQPTLKVVNRGAKGIRSVALWDAEQKNVVANFQKNVARPGLAEGATYHLVVQREDGSEMKMLLRASAATETKPLILIVP